MIEFQSDDGAALDATVWTGGAPSASTEARRPRVLARLGRSLRLRLAAAGGLIAGASMIGIVLGVLFEVEQQVVDAQLHADVFEVQRVASVVDARLEVLTRAVKGAAEPTADPESAMHLLASHSGLLSLFDSLFVASPDGRFLAYRSAGGFHPASGGLGKRDYFRRSLESLDPVVSPLVVGQVSLRPSIHIAHASRAADGRPVSVFAGSLDTGSARGFADLTRRDERSSATTVVVDSEGRVVSHPDPDRLLRPIFEDPGISSAFPTLARLPFQRDKATLVVRRPGQIVSAAAVPGVGWNVVRVTDDARLLAELMRLRLVATGIALAIAVAAGTLMFWVTSRMFAPMRQLQRRALTVLSDSGGSDAGWPDGADEIGELARVFRHILRERESISAATTELLARVQAILANSPVGIAFTREQRFELVSPSLCRLLGYAPAELVGLPARRVYAIEDAYRAVVDDTVRASSADTTIAHEVLLVRKDASKFWGKLLGSPVDATDPDAGTIWIFEDISQAREMRERLNWTATHDGLTSLVNRREFDARLRDALARADRGPLCALFIDLDRFKAVNDTAGHAAGDRVLFDVARLLESGVRGSDTVARLGGDEFAVILENCGTGDGERVAEKLRGAVETYRLCWEDAEYSVGASIGLVECGPQVTDVSQAIEAADRACYAAKRAGRNRVATISADPPCRPTEDSATDVA